MSKATVLLSPGRKLTRSKPFNSLTGRVTELTRSRMYIWTVSVPSRLPVFVTSASTRVEPRALIRFFVSRMLPISNFV